MKFTVSKTSLLAELARLQGIVEKKSTIPTLATILLESADLTDVRMLATDLDVSLGTTCPAEIHEPGAICIPGKRLYEIVRSLPDAEIEIRTEGDAVHIKCQKSKFKLMGLGKEHFPEVKAPEDGKGVRINGTLWAEAVRRTIYACTAEESRYALQSQRIQIGNGKLIVVATDGHRLAYLEAAGEYGADEQVILIPRKAMQESAKLATDGDFLISVTEGHVHFVSGKRTLSSRLASGQFPNYELVLPKDNNLKATVSAAELASAIRRVNLMADERSHAVKLDFGPDGITVAAQSAEAGEGSDTVNADYNGEPITAGFNATYLLDVLTLTDIGTAVISIKDANAQFEITFADETRFLMRQVIMPQRLT